MLRTGRRDRKILIQRATLTSNSYGEAIRTWASHFSAWAEVRFLSGSELFKSNRELSGKTALFIIPFSDDLKTSDRIYWQAETWDIISIKELGRREGLELLAEVSEIEA